MQTQNTDIHIIFKKLENHIKKGGDMPEIKYWSGTECFSDYTGHYKADTLLECVDLYLNTENADTAS